MVATANPTKDKIAELEKRIKILEREMLALESLLKEYFPLSIKKLLQRKGLRIVREDKDVPVENKTLLFASLKSYYFRRVLHDVMFLETVKHKEKSLLIEKWGNNVPNYLEILKELDLVSAKGNTLKSNFSVFFMGKLLEWFIGQYLKENLHLETIINVRLKNFQEGGDIDVLSRIGTKLIMIESKESPPNNIPVSELKAISKRIEALKPDLFILAIDTTLSIKRNIIDNLRWIVKAEPIKVKEGIYKAKKSFFIVTAKRNLLQNIAFCISEAANGIR